MSAGLLLIAGPASAQLSFSGCALSGPSSFKVCTSAETWYDDASGTLYFKVANLNQSASSSPDIGDYHSDTGGWHTITAIGLSNLVYGRDYTLSGIPWVDVTYSNGGSSTSFLIDPWRIGGFPALGIDRVGASTWLGHVFGIVGGYDPGNSLDFHLQTTGDAYVQFAISGFSSFAFNDEVLFQWHSEQIASDWCVPTGSGSKKGKKKPQVKSCSVTGTLAADLPPTSTVPEPFSVALLGSGLAGIAFVRRRKGNSEEGNA